MSNMLMLRRRRTVAARSGFSPASLFAGGENGAFYQRDATSDMSATQTDPSGNGNDATLSGSIYSVTLSDLGSNATIAYVTPQSIIIANGQTVSGSTQLNDRWLSYVILDRALTSDERADLVEYMGRSGATEPDIFVDSVNGSDANDGATADAALATLSAAQTAMDGIGEGGHICFARGGAWRGRFSTANDNLVIASFGRGDQPELDGAIVASAWAKTAGRTNVYETTFTAIASNLAVNTPGIWENNSRIRSFASGLADLDATPGAFWHDDVSGDVGSTSTTLYFHASDSSDPGSNGNTYEVSAYDSCIEAQGSNGSVVADIATKRPYSSYGGIAVGRNCTVRDCVADEGTSHNLFCREGSEIYNTSAAECYSQLSAATMFIGFDTASLGASGGKAILFDGCTASMSDRLGTVPIGFYVHSGGTITFSSVTYRGCNATNLAAAYDAANTTTTYLTNSDCDTCSSLVTTSTTNVVSVDCTVTNTGSLTGAITAQFSAGLHTFDNVTSELNTTGYIRLAGSNTTLAVSNSSITLANIGIYDTGSSNTISINNCTIGTRDNPAFQFYAMSDTLYTGDNNTFVNAGKWTYNGTDYTTLAAWQTFSGEDTNSVTA